ncbi:MAG: PAS domain S-box protein [Chloroflexi bacterium]|nr:PAS domain S-box protein [Chloroflexota bacterium]
MASMNDEDPTQSEGDISSEARFAAVLETMVDAVITIDERGTVLSGNSAVKRIFGYDPDDMVGRNVSMLMPAAFSVEHTSYIQKYLETGEATIIGIGRETTGLRSDGTEFPIDLAISESHVGPRRLFTGIVRDISERKQAEAKIQSLNLELENRVQERTQQLESANASLSREASDRTALAEITRIITSSPRVGDVFGNFAEQVENLVPFDRMSICAFNSDGTLLTETFVSTGSGEGSAVGPDLGVTCPVPGTAAGRMLNDRTGVILRGAQAEVVLKNFPCHLPLFDDSRDGDSEIASALGAPIIAADRVIGTLNLVSLHAGAYDERSLAILEMIGGQIGAPIENSRLYEEEASLRDAAEVARARLESILQVSAAAVLIVNAADGRVLLATQEAERIIGNHIRPGELPSQYRKGVKYSRPDGTPIKENELPLLRATTSGEVVREQEVNFERPDGSRIPALISAAPVLGPDGGVSAGIAVFQDITELKHLDEVKADFLSMITHDLRGPVSAIKGLATAAMVHAGESGDDGDLLREDLVAVNDESDRLAELVSNLLDMSRIEAGAVQLEPEETHIVDLTEDAVRRATRSRVGEGRQISVTVPVDLPLMYVDPVQIGRVLDNLISNALKYSDGPINVEATYNPDNDTLDTAVSDSGLGVAAEVQEAVFEKFFRVTDAGRKSGMGAGLGLAICKAIVESHGGEIGVVSAPRQGSRFSFTLPLQPKE